MFVSFALAQEPAKEDKRFEVNSITITGNKAFSESFLLKQMTTKTNPSGFSRFINKLGLGLGSPPVYFSRPSFNNDINDLKVLYKDNGFDEVIIDTVKTINKSGNAVDLQIKISEGYQSLVDSVV